MSGPVFERLRTRGAQVLADHRVVFAYLFGSHARHKAHAGSDIDVAVYLDEEVTPSSYLDVRLALAADLADLLETDTIDVVILNEAPVALAYRVVREGEVVFCREDGARIEHWATVVDRYIDMEPMRKTLAEGTRHRLQEGRFGRS